MNTGWMVVVTLAFVACLGFSATLAGERDDRVYEMRTYWSPEGRLDDLHGRFRNHTLKLFEKHGMTNVGYWVPLDNPDHRLVYLLSYPSKEAREASWKTFINDPAWKEVKKQTEASGPIVAKVEALFLKTTDYSPAVKPSQQPGRVFELRTYSTPPGRLPNLNARFRDHTVKLFEKHGMTNIGYWTPIAGEKDADTTLIYFLAHKSVDAAKASFGAFRTDPAWAAALKASEEKAGGSLTTKGGVRSLFMKPTDYSPIR